ncbi:MAG: hypothetical protein AAB403_12295 [Planctomycetota bacterium]
MFDQMVKQGRLPEPKKFGVASVWDMQLLDQAFGDTPSSANDDPNPFD